MKKIYSAVAAIMITAIVLFVAWYFSSIVWCLVISSLLALIGRPFTNALRKVRIYRWLIPKWAAAGITLLLIFFVVFFIFYAFIPIIFNKFNELSLVDIDNFVASLKATLGDIDNAIRQNFNTDANFSVLDKITKEIESAFYTIFERSLISIPSFAINFVVWIFSITFITFFFLKEDHLLQDIIIVLFPKQYEENIKRAMASINNLLLRYFSGILAESIIMTTLISSLLLIFGMSTGTAFFIGVVMGILNVIPYIGVIIGLCLSIFVGVATPAEGMSVKEIIFIILGTIIPCKMLDDFVIQPFLYSKRAKAHPLEIFLVILIAGSMAGVLGMLLAIPSYNVLRVLAKEFFNNFPIVQKLTTKI